MRDLPGELQPPDMHQSFSDTTLCGYTASLYKHRYLVHLVSKEQIWLATVHVAVSFQLIVYAIIKKYGSTS